ncbi:hypothetical protein [Streptomyces roseolus]|uniref:hypothetical protein n=1 Tax=Streptomyces roseolus TaxID=67358 RepID=UPI00167A42F6|nr:hypothetical protein [Streptomyces roseolus]
MSNRRPRPGTTATAAAGLALIAAGLSAGPAAARASASVLACAGYETATYQPGLTLTEQQVIVTASGAVGPCTGTDLQHTGGSISFQGQGQLACTGGNSSGSGVINWSNPQTDATAFDFTGGVSLRPGGVSVLLLTGEVRSGDFQGSQISVEIALVPSPTESLRCTTPEGLSTSSGVLSVQII